MVDAAEAERLSLCRPHQGPIRRTGSGRDGRSQPSQWGPIESGARTHRSEPGPRPNDQTVPPTEVAVLLALEIAEAVRVPPAMMLTV